MIKAHNRTVPLALAAIVLAACGSGPDGHVTAVASPAPKDPEAIAVLAKLKAMGTEKERQDYMHAHQDEMMRLRDDPGAFAQAHKLAYGSEETAATPPPPKS